MWLESRYAKARGVVALTEGIHPQTAAISGGFGRWTGHPVAAGTGTSHNIHLAIDLEHTSMLGGAMETVGKIKIVKAESH